MHRLSLSVTPWCNSTQFLFLFCLQYFHCKGIPINILVAVTSFLLRQSSTSPPCRRSSWWLSQTDSGLDSGWNLIQSFREKHRQNQIDSTSSVFCSFRFMRFARILNLPDMLFFMKVDTRFKVWRCQHYVKVIEKSDNIRLAQITCQILAVFFMSAGGHHQINWQIHLEEIQYIVLSQSCMIIELERKCERKGQYSLSQVLSTFWNIWEIHGLILIQNIGHWSSVFTSCEFNLCNWNINLWNQWHWLSK